MRISYMGGLIQNFKKKGLPFFLPLAFLVASCAPPAVVGDRCSEEFEDIVRTVSANPEIKGYASDFFADSIPIVWDRDGRSLSSCPNISIRALTDSSSPKFRYDHPFVLINRIYFDNDAAFVNLRFHPSGKNVDAFMRKRNGVWRVVEKEMWEE